MTWTERLAIKCVPMKLKFVVTSSNFFFVCSTIRLRFTRDPVTCQMIINVILMGIIIPSRKVYMWTCKFKNLVFFWYMCLFSTCLLQYQAHFSWIMVSVSLHTGRWINVCERTCRTSNRRRSLLCSPSQLQRVIFHWRLRKFYNIDWISYRYKFWTYFSLKT